MLGNNLLEHFEALPGAGANRIRNGLAADAVGEVNLAKRAEAFAVGDRMAVVREYSHPLRPGWTEGSRSDFAETVYWNAGVLMLTELSRVWICSG